MTVRRRRRALGAVVLVVASTTGCGRFASSGDDRSTAGRSTTTVRYGSGVSTADEPTTTASAAGPSVAGPGDGRTATTASAATAVAPTEPKGDVDLRVVGPTGIARSGVPVRFEGAVTRTVTSDREGHVRTSLPPGRYRATPVEGCVGQLVVRRASGAEVGVADGDTARGDLVAEVGPRFLPAAPVSYSGDAPWRPGEVHIVSLRLADACDATRPPSPAAYRAARFVANPVAEVVTPLSDEVTEAGMVQVALRCGGDDEDVTLDLVDVVDEAEKTPVLASALMADQSRPFCIS